MQTQRQRCEEEIRKELSKKTKKETMIPLARLLGLAGQEKLKRDEFVQFLAANIAMRLDALRNCQLSPLQRVRTIIDKLASSQDATTANVVYELKEILMKVYRLEQVRTNEKSSPLNPMQNIKNSKACICKMTCSMPIRQSEATCRYCQTSFHKECFRIVTDIFECPYCSLQLLDPYDQVLECYCIAFFSPVCNRFLQFEANPKLSSTEAVEIRCVRIDGENHCRQTWPDAGSLIFNGEHLEDFKPLTTNASNKKRLDLATTTGKLKEKNTIALIFEGKNYCLQSYRISFSPHLIGVFKIRRLSITELVNKLQLNLITREESIETLKKSLKIAEGEDIEMPGIKISLKCILSAARIQIPARGRFCKHFACFDLKNVITMNWKIKKWTCPICKDHIMNMIVDPILLEIIETYPTATAVYFPKEGERQILSESLEQQQQELSDRIKKIKKTRFSSINLDGSEQSVSNPNQQLVQKPTSKNQSVVNQVSAQPEQPMIIPPIEEEEDFVWLEQIPVDFPDPPKKKKQESKLSKSRVLQKAISNEGRPVENRKQISQAAQIVLVSEQEVSAESAETTRQKNILQLKGELEYIRTMAPRRFFSESILTQEQVQRIEKKTYRAFRTVKALDRPQHTR